MTALPLEQAAAHLRRRRDPPSTEQGPDRSRGKQSCAQKDWRLGEKLDARLGQRLAEASGTAWLRADHPAGRADRRLLAVLVLTPHVDDHPDRSTLRAQLLHDAANRETIAGIDRLHERHRHRAALDEARAEQARHHLRDVRRRHHSLRERRAEPFATRPRLVAVNRPCPHAGVRIDVALRELLFERWQLVTDGQGRRQRHRRQAGMSICVNCPRTSGVPASSTVTNSVTIYCLPRRSYLSMTRPRECTRIPTRIGSRNSNCILACRPAWTT